MNVCVYKKFNDFISDNKSVFTPNTYLYRQILNKNKNSEVGNYFLISRKIAE